MTQTTDEHNFEPGFYVIGIFDVLGQRSRLVEPITFPPRTDDETEAVVRDLRDTAIAVDRFRRLFRGQFDERRVVLAEEVSQVPASHRAQVEAALGDQPRVDRIRLARIDHSLSAGLTALRTATPTPFEGRLPEGELKFREGAGYSV